MPRATFLMLLSSALIVLALLCPSTPALAHRVNIFAFVDGSAIQVECAFSRSNKVRQGKLSISDAATGEPLVQGLTNDQGEYRFRPPEDFLGSGHGLTISLNAGEGHQAVWSISPEELQALAPAETTGQTAGETASPVAVASPLQPSDNATPPADKPTTASTAATTGNTGTHQGKAASTSAPTVAATGLNPAELEALLGKVLDAKLAPIKHALAAQDNDGPSLRDIVGGLGWILGLLGVAAYMQARKVGAGKG
jgi:nickel transport protein